MKELAWDQFELVLLEPWCGSNIGDVVRVKAGMYDTLLNLKKAVRVEYYEDNITDRQKLVITIKNLEKDNEKQRYEIEDLDEEIEDLDEQVKELEAKVKANESNKPRAKKKVKKTKKKVTKTIQ